MGREGQERGGGREKRGREGGGKGEGTEEMEGTGEDMGWDGEGRERERRKGRDREERGYTAPNFNSWRRHCRQVAGSNPGSRAAECNLGQVVYTTHLRLSLSSIIWYQPMGSDALRLGR